MHSATIKTPKYFSIKINRQNRSIRTAATRYGIDQAINFFYFKMGVKLGHDIAGRKRGEGV